MKPVGQAGAGANNFGGITAFTRTWPVRGEENGPDLNEPIVTSKQLPERLPFEGNGRTGLIILKNQIPEYFNGDIDDLPDLYDAYLRDYDLQDPRNFVEIFRQNNSPFFYNLFIGSDITSIEDFCFKDVYAAGPVTSFDGGQKYIGEEAFYNYGVGNFNVFSNLTNLIINERSFSKSPIGKVLLKDCDVSNAISAFEDSYLCDEITLDNCIGNLIPDSFAKNAVHVFKIILNMDGGSIGDYAFYKNKSAKIEINYNCTEVGVSAFEDNEATSATIPSSITLFKDKAFYNAGIFLLKTNGEINAVFKDECFSLNKINHVDGPMLINGTFEFKSFFSAFRGSDCRVRGSITGLKAFANNRFNKLMLEASISNDYTFFQSEVTEDPVTIQNPIVGRHTFTGLKTTSDNNFIVQDMNDINSSYRTFQIEAKFDSDPPVPSVGWIPSGGAANGWSAVYDKVAWHRGDCLFMSSRNNVASWVNDAPAQVTVEFGGNTVTLAKTVNNIQGGTIEEFSYLEEYEGDPALGNIDYYSVSLEYHPWGKRWKDLEEDGHDIIYGKGGWISNASSANYAQNSPTYLQTDSPETMIGTFYQDQTFGGNGSAFVCTSQIQSSNLNISKTSSKWPNDGFLETVRLEAGYTVKIPTPFTPVFQDDEDDFRRKHMFYGRII